jgi:hypothetical protein
MVTFLLEHWKSIEDDLFTGTPTMEKRAFRSNVNARDSKGWNPCSVASFHGQKSCLLKILENGGNPRVVNFYGKDSFAIVKTETDNLGAVLREGKPEIVDCLEMWEADQQRARILTGKGDSGESGGSGVETISEMTLVEKAKKEGLKDAGPIALQEEMALEAAKKKKTSSSSGSGSSKKKGKKGKGSAAGGGANAVKSLKKKKGKKKGTK